jgi:4-hydroxy-tetrahydrodipicolinate reductase
MLRCVICGAAGRMGKRLVTLACENVDLEVVGAVEHPESPAIGQDVGELAGVGRIGVPIGAELADVLSGADVVISFVNIAAACILQGSVCAEAGVPMIVGSTGFTDDEETQFGATVAGIPVVKASNFSVGISVLLSLVENASELLGDGFDIEIIESHHTKKKDAPSGTAISLAQAAADGRNWSLDETARHGREGLVGERPQKEIGMHAVRAGDIVGHHTVLFGGAGETLELVHRAQSRDTFAAGALRAAAWVVGQEPGVYDMRSVLGLER